ncbi:unnamed protein product [Lampetra fluviatilis]
MTTSSRSPHQLLPAAVAEIHGVSPERCRDGGRHVASPFVVPCARQEWQCWALGMAGGSVAPLIGYRFSDGTAPRPPDMVPVIVPVIVPDRTRHNLPSTWRGAAPRRRRTGAAVTRPRGARLSAATPRHNGPVRRPVNSQRSGDESLGSRRWDRDGDDSGGVSAQTRGTDSATRRRALVERGGGRGAAVALGEPISRVASATVSAARSAPAAAAGGFLRFSRRVREREIYPAPRRSPLCSWVPELSAVFRRRWPPAASSSSSSSSAPGGRPRASERASGIGGRGASHGFWDGVDDDDDADGRRAGVKFARRRRVPPPGRVSRGMPI